MTPRFSRTALRQLDRILTTIEIESPQGARRVRDRMREVIWLLADHPLAGTTTDRANVRRIVVTPFPYVIFYRAIAGEVIVLRIRHAARDPRDNPGRV